MGAVALRKESVDRNPGMNIILSTTVVALRKESVDRNNIGSASIRACIVALRKESVDRNTQRRDFKCLGLLSLSARRAWIEMTNPKNRKRRSKVALRKESVDRNAIVNTVIFCIMGRSPQGERG